MSKIAHYLQEHLVGEVLTTADARKFFSTDGSVLSITPSTIVYPQNENDVRKTARFTWQLAERGRVIPITARGLGTDRTGAAIGNGIILVFPAHMNRLLELDSKSGAVVVEPGITYSKLQQTLHSHGRFLPPYPSSHEFSTVGGAIANNTGGEKSLKYGDTRHYVKELRVVLANGEVIETRRLNKREFSKKMGLATFEGEIYRSLDVIFEENQELIDKLRLTVSKNTAGYDLLDVKTKDGFDLTPLIVGSQGTLGIITEASLGTASYNPNTSLVAAFFDDKRVAQEVILELIRSEDSPSALEIIEANVLKFLEEHHPNQLKGVLEGPLPELVALIEYDNLNERNQKRAVKKTEKALEHYEIKYQTETEDEAKEKLWKIRQAAAIFVTHHQANLKALPIIDDGIVPVERFQEYLEAVQALLQKNHVNWAMWGHGGNGNMHIYPFLDLGQVGDRQKVFKLMDDYYKLIISLGGSTSGEHGDGRMRSAYLPLLYGEEAYVLFQKVKRIFDPYDTLNPGVKINANLEEIKQQLRYEYSVDHLYNHLPNA